MLYQQFYKIFFILLCCGHLAYAQEDILLVGHQKAVYGLAFSHDGRYLASTSADSTVRVWLFEEGRNLYTFRSCGSFARAVTFSPKGDQLFFSCDNNSYQCWSLEGKMIFNNPMESGYWIHSKGVNSIFSPDAHYLIAVDYASILRIFDIHGRKMIKKQPLQHPGIWALTCSYDSKYIAVTDSYNLIKIYDFLSGELINSFSGQDAPMVSIAFSPDGNYLATGALDQHVKIWTQQGVELATVKAHHNSVWALAFSPDGKYLATAGFDKQLFIWTLHGKPVRSVTDFPQEILQTAFSPDGKWLAVAGNEGMVKLIKINR